MEKTRGAVVSTNGIRVDAHFGKAERFLIYDLEDPVTWVEDRPVEPLSTGDAAHRFDADRFNRIVALLQDCRKVFVTRIGDIPAAKLAAMGIEAVICDGDIADVLE